MNEFLTVRLSRNNQSPIRWLVWSTSQNEIIASGELNHREQLGELSSYAQQRTTILLLDSRDTLLTETEVPAGASRKLEGMLPYLLEDEIAQDVEDLHFTVLQKSGNTAQIAAIDRNYLSECLGYFKQAGIEVKKALPDVHCLPLLDESISTLKLDQQWLFRASKFKTATVDESWINVLFQSDWLSNDDTPATIVSYTGEVEQVSDKVVWTNAEPELEMELLTKGAIHATTNLLSGPFKVQSSILKNIKIWRKAAIAACLFLVVLTAQRYIQVGEYEQQALAYRAESERIFRTIFPGKRKIPTISYLKGQMNSEENRLSGSSNGESVLDWLEPLPAALKDQPSATIQNIRYDANRGEVRIEAIMDDFQAFEVVRTKLAEKFTVSQGPLDREGEKVSGSFVLRRKQ